MKSAGVQRILGASPSSILLDFNYTLAVKIRIISISSGYIEQQNNWRDNVVYHNSYYDSEQIAVLTVTLEEKFLFCADK